MAMETDFRVKVSVSDLKDEKALGDWIARVMGAITKLPADEIPGPQPGRVEFDFSKSETENLFLKKLLLLPDKHDFAILHLVNTSFKHGLSVIRHLQTRL